MRTKQTNETGLRTGRLLQQEAEEATPTTNDPAARTREWRERRRQQPGGLTQIIIWVPKNYTEPLRKIFSYLGDPDWRGSAYRSAVAHWLHRRRPAPNRVTGTTCIVEIDNPQIDNGHESVPIGGRVFGHHGAFAELTSDEADELNSDLQEAIERTTNAFLAKHDLTETVRDLIGVMPNEAALYPPDRSLNLEFDIQRPESEDQFTAFESSLASEIFDTHGRIVITPITSELYEMSYPGTAGMPSRCLALLKPSTPNQPAAVALIGLRQSGTPPTLKFEQLTTALRKMLPSAMATAPLRYFDVEPDEFSFAKSLQIYEVVENSADGKNDINLQWEPNPKHSKSLNREFREAVRTYERWKQNGRPAPEQDADLRPAVPGM